MIVDYLKWGNMLPETQVSILKTMGGKANVGSLLKDIVNKYIWVEQRDNRLRYSQEFMWSLWLKYKNDKKFFENVDYEFRNNYTKENGWEGQK